MGKQAAGVPVPLPLRDGVAPSYAWFQDPGPVAAEDWFAVRFPDIGAGIWRERMARGDVVDAAGARIAPGTQLTRGMRIWYYRELEHETPIPFQEQILYRDEHLLVVDKPHFLPTTPGGRFVRETLLSRLKAALGEPMLTPIHRLDRETAGVVLFSLRADSRGAYQSLFQQRRVDKVYEALAAPLARSFPFTYRSRMAEGTPFFRMMEVEGEPNAETLVDLLGMQGAHALYRLSPHTGRKHQLRVHMAALGAPILNDGFYPEALACKGDDFAHPLKLLARSISFDDPLSGQRRRFESGRTL